MMDLRQRALNGLLSRRRLVQAGAASLAGLALMPLIAACGGDDDDDNATTPAATTASGGSTPAATSASGGSTPAAGSTTGTGNGSTPAAGTTPGATGETPKSGGKIAMSLADQDIGNFDPIIPGDNMSIWTMLLIYDQVIRVGPDGLSIEPGLAEKWDISEDGITYTFHLRDAKFHDGTPMTAQDVEYCLTRAATDTNSIWTWIFNSVDHVTAVDDKTVQSTLKQVWVPYLSDVSLYASSIFPMAAHQAKQAALFDNPIGTGPFQFVEWVKEQHCTLKKNPNYWTPGQPYLDELNFIVLTDANQRMLQFQSGDLDIATDVPFSQLAQLKQDSNIQVRQDTIARIDYMGINCKNITDVKIRQAMNYAVDKDAIISNVLFGAGELATTMLPKMLYWNPDTVGYPYDLDKAKSLMAESTKPDGFDVEIILTAGDPVQAQVAQLVAANLGDIKVNAKITQIDPGAYFDAIQNYKFDLYKGYFTTDIIDPDELTSLNIMSNLGGQAAYTGWVNADVDALGAQAVSITDPDKRKDAYYQIQEMSTAEAPFLFLYYPTSRTALNKHIHDFKILVTANYRLWETWRDDV